MKSRRYLTPIGLSLAAKELVSSGFHVMSLNLRGHGGSDWDANVDYSIDADLSDLQAIIASGETAADAVASYLPQRAQPHRVRPHSMQTRAHMVASDRKTAFNAAVIEFLQRRLEVA